MKNKLSSKGSYIFTFVVTMSFLIQGFGNIAEGQEMKGNTYLGFLNSGE